MGFDQRIFHRQRMKAERVDEQRLISGGVFAAEIDPDQIALDLERAHQLIGSQLGHGGVLRRAAENANHDGCLWPRDVRIIPLTRGTRQNKKPSVEHRGLAINLEQVT